jgi:hypothetical protein
MGSTSSNADKRRRRKEKNGHSAMKDIGDVRSSSTVGNKGSSCQQQKTFQSATGITVMATNPKGLL